MPFAQSAMADTDSARQFAAQVLSLRAAGVIGGVPAQEFLDAMPGSGLAGEVPLRIIWSPFFENAIVKLGRLASSAPVALYYNPLLDIAIVSYWQKDEDVFHVSAIRALPGERLSDPDASVSLHPSWMRAENPIDTLVETTNSRLQAFRLANPAKSQEVAKNSVSFAIAAGDMRLVLPRLALNVQLRTRWTEQSMPWLFHTSEDVEKALTSLDSDYLLSASPDTDPETAAALSDLPAGFAQNLTLDAVLEAGDSHQLLIGSSPEDGDIYVLALCRMENTEFCELRRFELLSLVE